MGAVFFKWRGNGTFFSPDILIFTTSCYWTTCPFEYVLHLSVKTLIQFERRTEVNKKPKHVVLSSQTKKYDKLCNSLTLLVLLFSDVIYEVSKNMLSSGPAEPVFLTQVIRDSNCASLPSERHSLNVCHALSMFYNLGSSVRISKVPVVTRCMMVVSCPWALGNIH